VRAKKVRARKNRAIAHFPAHEAKKYENADINNKNKKSYLSYDKYPSLPFESA
jgi:hypothetical protein